MNIYEECGDLLFEHNVGSILIGTQTDTSDVDAFQVYITRYCPRLYGLHIPKGIDFTKICYAEINTDNKLLDIYGVTMYTLIRTLLFDEIDHPVHLSKTISHLYAVKNEQITTVYQEEAFCFYVNWLKSPGFSSQFWSRVKNVFFNHLSCIPDQECNWSQKFDGSSEHTQKKETWEQLKILQYPVVNKEVGYDVFQARKVLQTLLVAKSILLQQKGILDNEKDFLLRLKDHQVTFDEYKKVKGVIWREFRKAVEDNSLSFLGGSSHSIETSKKLGTYGIDGIEKLSKMTSEFR